MAEVVSIITNHVAKIRLVKYGRDCNHMAIIRFTPTWYWIQTENCVLQQSKRSKTIKRQNLENQHVEAKSNNLILIQEQS